MAPRIDREGIAKFARWFKRQTGDYSQRDWWTCLAVWAARWKNPSDEQEMLYGSSTFQIIFNVSIRTSMDIYYPKSDGGYDATRAQATRMLEHLAKTGRVKWDIGKR